MNPQIYQVYNNNTNVGLIEFKKIRNKEVVSFAYSAAYLNSPDFFNIDPNLSITSDRQYPSNDLLFGFLEDCSPDRWGKKILRHKLKRAPTRSESILLIADFLRMGAIRFFDESENKFLAEKSSVPLYAHISELLQESYLVTDNIIHQALQGRLDGTLGGARPKAVITDSNQLKLAKFPSKDDEIDVEAWEATLLDLARLIDINTPKTKLLRVEAAKYSVLVIDRFDRDNNERLYYLSAMSALNYHDGNTEGSSYIEISDFIAREGNIEDAQELWRRMVFNTIVHNKDDHLRNHGFLRIDNKWRLSPVFDLNPNVDKMGHELSIDGSQDPSLELAIELSEFFYVDAKNAKACVDAIQQSVNKNIEKIALKNKIPQREINAMLESMGITKPNTKKMRM